MEKYGFSGSCFFLDSGAEVAELVGLFLSSEINKLIPSAGLYRDDGAGVVQMSGPQITKVVKKLHAIFKKYKLKITVEANLKTTDFLDFEMDLNTAKVRPYRKPNNHPNYINVDSSHPKTTIKALPKMIQTRLSSLSSTEKEFEEVKAPYEDALKNAGYKEPELKFTKQEEGKKKRTRKRRIIWFNPPYSCQVSTNVTQMFNKLIDKHFKPGTLLRKLFNPNNLKLSYSTTANLNQIISGHNKFILSKLKPVEDPKLCNCTKEACLIGEQCLKSDVVYEADVVTVEENRQLKKYIGECATTFKARYNNHKSECKLPSKRYATKMSGYVWSLKDKKTNYDIKFKIREESKSYNPVSQRCLLCLTEKLLIMKASQDEPDTYLNDRSEMLCKCRHRNKFLLSNYNKPKKKNKD